MNSNLCSMRSRSSIITLDKPTRSVSVQLSSSKIVCLLTDFLCLRKLTTAIKKPTKCKVCAVRFSHLKVDKQACMIKKAMTSLQWSTFVMPVC